MFGQQLLENQKILNSERCHFTCFDNNGENKLLTFKNECYKNNKEEVILRISIDNKLPINMHIREICKESVQKLNASS